MQDFYRSFNRDCELVSQLPSSKKGFTKRYTRGGAPLHEPIGSLSTVICILFFIWNHSLGLLSAFRTYRTKRKETDSAIS